MTNIKNDTTYKILTELIGHSKPIGGDTIGNLLGISRNAVNKHIAKLKSAGHDVISDKKGYLYRTNDVLDEYILQYEMEKRGLNIDVFVKYCDSTNNYAKEKFIKGRAVFVAPDQSGGRGRLGRSFVCGEGGAYMTFAIEPKNLIAVDSLNLVLMSGLAVALLLRKYGADARIKWPNDVLADGKKICGILLESVLDSEYIGKMYLGIGINVYNDLTSISDVAVNLETVLGRRIRRSEVICDLSVIIFDMLDKFYNEGFTAFREEYLRYSYTVGKRVSVKNGGKEAEGNAIGISERGYLLLDNGEEITEIVAGDIMPVIENI